MTAKPAKHADMLTSAELKHLMTGQTLHAFDPDTGAHVASVRYGPGGHLTADFADGTADTGQWGLQGDHYWTQYDRFRGGARNLFYLQWLGPRRVQAYFADGRRAFVQSPDRNGGTDAI